MPLHAAVFQAMDAIINGRGGEANPMTISERLKGTSFDGDQALFPHLTAWFENAALTANVETLANVILTSYRQRQLMGLAESLHTEACAAARDEDGAGGKPAFTPGGRPRQQAATTFRSARKRQHRAGRRRGDDAVPGRILPARTLGGQDEAHQQPINDRTKLADLKNHLEQVKGLNELLIPKNRKGTTDAVRLMFDGATMTFRSFSPR